MGQTWAWVGAVAALLAPLGAVLANWWARQSTAEKQEYEWRDTREVRLYERQGQQLERCYARTTELEEEVARLETDRTRGWELARAWFDRAHEELHKHRSNLQLALSGKPNPELLRSRAPSNLPSFLDIKAEDPPKQ